MGNASSTLKLIIAGDNKGAVHAVDGVGSSLSTTTGKASGLGSALAGAFSVAAVTGFAKAAISGYEGAAGSVAKFKRLTGESAKDSSLLVFAAQQAGVGFDKVAASAGIFATNIKKGKVDAAGIATKDGNGNLLDFNTILDHTADYLHSLPPGFQRVAAARAIFGRGGADMAKILGVGSVALEAQRKKMQDLGLEFNEAGLRKYDKFVHLQRDVQAAVTGVEVAIGSKLASALSVVDKGFLAIPGPARLAVASVVGLGGALTAATLAAGAFGPVISRGAQALHLKKAAAVEATVSDDALAVAEADAAAAQEALTAAWATGTGVGEASTAATEANAAALEARTVAAGEASSSSIGLGAGLGIATAAAIVATGAYHELTTATKGLGNLKLPNLDPQNLLGQTNKELLKSIDLANRSGKTGFVQIGEANIKALYAMRDAAKASGQEFPNLAAAIKQVEDENKRSAARQKDNTTEVDAATVAFGKLTEAQKHYVESVAATKAVADAQSLLDLQTSAADAQGALVDSLGALATAQQAAVGNSDEYRAAQKQQTDDTKAEAKAVTDLATARKDEAKAVEDAKQHLEELRLAVISTGVAERDAQLAKDEAVAKARATLANEQSTPLEKEQAQVALADATDQVTLATQNHAKAESDQAKASVDNDAGVVSAKQKVVDAENKVKETQAAVAADAVAKKKILVQAGKDEKDAQDKVNTALLNQVETAAKVTAAMQGPIAGQKAFAKGLKGIYDSLDPSSPLAKRVGEFYQAVLAAITVSQGGAGGVDHVDPNSSLGKQIAAYNAAHPGAGKTGAPIPIAGSVLDGGRSIHQHIHVSGTPTQTTRAFRREGKRQLEDLVRGTR